LHQYLRAIGFSNIENKKQLHTVLENVVTGATQKDFVEAGHNSIMVEYSKEFADSIGLTVRGEFDEDNVFTYEFYYPYCKGIHISTEEDVTVERHAEKETYAGVCDDIKVGVSLIFYVQNVLLYLKEKNAGNLPKSNTSVTLSGLSLQGKIMLPINKNEKEKQKIQKAAHNRNHLIAAARQGDEEAIESLTLEDIDTYTTISRKILKEDVFSLVDSYFMPYGVECDQYSILGEIEDFELVQNSMTKEEIYIITLNCNELLFDICINKADLLGEPQIGRRFKGVVWMQGKINFPD
jgi:hypothetical protein